MNLGIWIRRLFQLGYFSSAFWRWINNPPLWQIPWVQLHMGNLIPLCADGDSRTAHHLCHTDPHHTSWSYQTESWWRLCAQILFRCLLSSKETGPKGLRKVIKSDISCPISCPDNHLALFKFTGIPQEWSRALTRAHMHAPASPRLQINCVSAFVGWQLLALSGWSESENRRHTSPPPLPSPAQCEEQQSTSSSSSLLFSPVWIQSSSRAEVLPTCALGKLRPRLHTQPFCPRTNLTVWSLHDDAERATLAPRSPSLPALHRGVQFIWVHRGALWEGREVRRILQSDITGSEQSEGG